jgi:hypothetical protein
MTYAWLLLEEECDFDNYENDCWYKDVVEAHEEYLEQE